MDPPAFSQEYEFSSVDKMLDGLLRAAYIGGRSFPLPSGFHLFDHRCEFADLRIRYPDVKFPGSTAA
jgi:hypothetical protein